MGNRREFDIAFVGLKPGLHEFNYEVDDKFFANYKETDFTNCHATIKLTLEKKHIFFDVEVWDWRQCKRDLWPLRKYFADGSVGRI